MQRENLSPSDEDRQKMIKELEELGVDDPNYSTSEMEQILQLMYVSKETANRSGNSIIRNQKQDSSPPNNFVPDITNKAESIIETKNERPKPSCSYMEPRDSNLEFPSLCDKKNIYKGKNLDDSNSDESPKFKTSKQEYHNLRKKLEQQKKVRWRINPLDCHSNENDVALQQPARRPSEERMPFGLCKDACTIEKENKVISKLSIHLKEMADLWVSSHGSTDLKFQWGSPIQVCTTMSVSNH